MENETPETPLFAKQGLKQYPSSSQNQSGPKKYINTSTLCFTRSSSLFHLKIDQQRTLIEVVIVIAYHHIPVFSYPYKPLKVVYLPSAV